MSLAPGYMIYQEGAMDISEPEAVSKELDSIEGLERPIELAMTGSEIFMPLRHYNTMSPNVFSVNARRSLDGGIIISTLLIHRSIPILCLKDNALQEN